MSVRGILTVLILFTQQLLSHALNPDLFLLGTEIPGRYHGLWWMGYADNNAQHIKVEITANALRIKADQQVIEDYRVDTVLEMAPLFYFLRRNAADANDMQCEEWGMKGDVLLSRNVTVPDAIKPNIRVGECKKLIFDSNGDYRVMIKYANGASVTFSNSTDCAGDLIEGTYQLQYSETSNNWQCTNMDASTGEIKKTTVNLMSCFTGVGDYERMFDSKLGCVGDFSATAIGSVPTKGDVQIFSVDLTQGRRYFYCVRYQVDYATHQIKMSFGTHSENAVFCKDDQTFFADDANYQAMIFTANDCKKKPCLNSGTCNQQLGSYTCSCAPGFTGDKCETNIDECASRPCLNGGICIDGINSYTCSCTIRYIGRHCQRRVCQLSSDYIKTWGWDYKQGNARSMTYNTSYLNLAQGTQSDIYVCENDGEVGNDFTVLTARAEATTTDVLCSKIKRQGNILLHKSTQMTTPNRVVVSTCEDQLRPKGDNYIVSAATPADPSSYRPCPFPAGNYQDQFTYNGQTNCSNDFTSLVDFRARDKMVLSACGSLTDNSYETPTQGNLVCVDNFAATEIGDGSGSDGIVILECTDGTNKYYYCARWTVRANKLYVSAHTAAQSAPVCEAGKSASAPANNYFSMQLTPMLCRDSGSTLCLNGGTCNDVISIGMDSQGFRCTCRLGFTGTNCETNVNECASSPCQNNGTCVDDINKYRCSCLPGYSGPVCQNLNECHSNPCQNVGTCEDKTNRYTCQCSPGWTGYNCETEINECASQPCKNDGTCNEFFNYYNCTCPPGISGVNCELNRNECDSQPCQNGGTCHDRINGYYCRCTDHYLGVHCEHFDECGSNPCQHGATCKDDLGFYTCICNHPWTGVHCETNPSTSTTTPAPTSKCVDVVCQNGGTCVDGTCVCRAGYTGSKCEDTDVTSSPAGGISTITWTLIVLICIFIAAVAVAGGAIMVKKSGPSGKGV